MTPAYIWTPLKGHRERITPASYGDHKPVGRNTRVSKRAINAAIKRAQKGAK